MSKYTAFLLLCWTIVFANGYNFLGGMEGYFNPVVKDFQIEQTSADPTSIVFYGTFDKVRDCNFVSMYGSIEKDNHYTHIPVIFEDTTRIRTPGKQEFGPWRVKITTEHFDGLQLYAIHHCHSGYLTKTKIY